ncbi:MAG TPA: hypothetical protein VFA88_00760 [Gaiellaceae bacterium]|jgi:hypothetical protein|nr:hypothetical protein [Gaiellaceae bacterium]
MDWRVSLRYPDGRTHETTISVESHMHPGREFAAFGRRWRVVDAEVNGDNGDEPEPMVCECIGFDTGTLVGRLGEREQWTNGVAQ